MKNPSEKLESVELFDFIGDVRIETLLNKRFLNLRKSFSDHSA